jgi:hypothetical protein
MQPASEVSAANSRDERRLPRLVIDSRLVMLSPAEGRQSQEQQGSTRGAHPIR